MFRNATPEIKLGGVDHEASPNTMNAAHHHSTEEEESTTKEGLMTQLARRSLLTGLSVAALLPREVSRAQAQQQFEGVQRTLFKEFRSMIPGVAKIVLREVTYQPSAKSSRTMPHTMVCECTKGILQVTQDAMTATINTGELWTCHKGMPETVENKGMTPAVMRVIELVPV